MIVTLHHRLILVTASLLIIERWIWVPVTNVLELDKSLTLLFHSLAASVSCTDPLGALTACLG